MSANEVDRRISNKTDRALVVGCVLLGLAIVAGCSFGFWVTVLQGA